MFDNYIFDLDGTLWNAVSIIKETWNIILNDYNSELRPEITEEELGSCMGLQLHEISQRLFPMLDKKEQKFLMDSCCRLENQMLAKHGGRLYEGTMETLEKLKKRAELFIVSNCQCGYIEAFFEGNKTGSFFSDFECAGNTGMGKAENIELIIKRNNLKNCVYIGDTEGDRQGAVGAKIPFIYAAYGFGTVKQYDYRIDKFSELVNL